MMSAAKVRYILLLGWVAFLLPSGGFAAESQGPEFVVEAERGSDLTLSLQAGIDKARAAGGGTIILPAGGYVISDTVQLAGSFKKFSRGGASISLRGGPTLLTYKGEPDKSVLDMASPNGCTISNLTIDGDNVPGTVGIRYRAGYERGVNGGKGNTFENIELRRLDIGCWIGDPFAPDLVGSGFYSLKINWCRIGLLVEGGNVAGMSFYNPLISGFREAGIKLTGHTSRLIRRSPDTPLPPVEVAGSPAVLTNIQTGEEIFEKDVPEYALKARAFVRSFEGAEYFWAPGGAPEITLYNANFGGQAANAWAIDTNWGNVRVYSARVEGVQGFFRRTSTAPPSRFTDLFLDVSVTSYGGTTGNVFEYAGAGPFYLYGGAFSGRVALGNHTKVYAIGTRFQKGKFPFYPGLVPVDFALDEAGAVVRTGEQKIFPGRFATYDEVQVAPVENPGFTQLAGTGNARVFGGEENLSDQVEVAAGEQKVTVQVRPVLPDASYRVSAMPGFDAGNLWVTNKTANSFVLNWKNPAAKAETIDWTLRYQPFRVTR